MAVDRRSPYQPPRQGAVELPCRVCMRYVRLDPDRIFRAGDYDNAYWAYRCPECGGSFPVRDNDVPAEIRH